MKKSRGLVILEASLYVLIASGNSLIGFVEPGKPVNWLLAGATVTVATATALKAFLSQAFTKSDWEV